MEIYHPHFGLPELAALNSRQRRIIWRGVTETHPVTLRLAPAALYSVWILLLVFMFAPYGQRLTGHLWGAMLIGCSATLLLSVLQDRALAWLCRGHIRRYIKNHETEIQALA